MLAHHQGGLLNVAELARNLGVDGKTAAAYIDLLSDLFLVRRLPPWHANLGKRLVKSPKVYVRDSGLLHALLAIGDKDTLLGHPVVGAGWEGFVMENLLASARRRRKATSTAPAAERRSTCCWPGRTVSLWAVEIKRSLSPRPERGFHAACADLHPERRFVVYPGQETYPIAGDTLAIPLDDLADLLAQEGA